jgi:adenylate cyclase
MAPENFNVYDRYLKARSYFHRSLRPPWHAGKQASDLAKIEFKRAIEISDPPYWPLYAGLAWQHAIDFDWSYSNDENKSLSLAFENAEIAVKNAPESHLAHWSIGWAYLYTKRNHQRAMDHYTRARELNVGDSRLLAEMAQPLIYSGDPERAVTQLHQAIRLNPLHEQWYDEFLAWAYEESGQPERTIEVLSRIGELEGIWSHAVLARAFAQVGELGHFREQIVIIDKMARERKNTKFSLEFWKEWVAQREPYKDRAGSERIVRIMEDALRRSQ